MYELKDIENKILHGHILSELAKFPDNIIDTIITSPPYWSARFYPPEINTIWDADLNCEHNWNIYIKGKKKYPDSFSEEGQSSDYIEKHEQKFCTKCNAWFGQLGLEPTPNLYIKHLTDISNELRRILKPTGVFFLNIGDSYAGSMHGYGIKEPNPDSLQSLTKGYDSASVMMPPSKTSIGSEPWIVPKQLLLIPFRVAASLQNNKWILRQDIIWHKNSCLPTTARDRFTSSYEHIFMFVKNRKYFFNDEFSRKEYEPASVKRVEYQLPLFGGHESGAACTGSKKGGGEQRYISLNPKGAKKHDVWNMNTANYHGAHFATFPPILVENCIKPGCPKEVCTVCGKPKIPIVKKTYIPTRPGLNTGTMKSSSKDDPLKSLHDREITKKRMKMKYEYIGMFPSCKCNSTFKPGIVFDPFAGSGTALAVAKKLGYRYCGIELCSDYIKIIEARLGSML